MAEPVEIPAYDSDEAVLLWDLPVRFVARAGFLGSSVLVAVRARLASGQDGLDPHEKEFFAAVIAYLDAELADREEIT